MSGRLGFNPMSYHTKDLKIVLDVTLLSTQHYNVRIKGKVEQSLEWSSSLLYATVELLLKREPSPPHLAKVANFTFYFVLKVIGSYLMSLDFFISF